MPTPAGAVAVPTIDLTPAYVGGDGGKQQVAAAIDRACREVGFFTVVGHQVPSDLIEEMRAVSRRFMDLPAASKAKVKMPPDVYRGYASPDSQSLAASYGQDSPPDLKESFSIGPLDVPDEPYYTTGHAAEFFAPNLWPTEDLPELEPTWRAYYRQMERLATDITRLFALALGLDEHWFDDKIDRHITDLSAIHYPPLTAPPLEGQLRGGAHTDFGHLTLVLADAAPGGLQVLLDGHWVDVPHNPDAFVVNIGDLMAEWTNDRWVSTVHRVDVPPTVGDPSSDRLSFTFFFQPNYDAVIEVLPTCTGPGNPPRYEPTTSGEHFLAKQLALRSPEALAEHG